MVAVEQPVSKHFSIVSDRLSGTHHLAAVIGVFGWHPRRELVVIVAYKVPNNAASGKPAPLLRFHLRGKRKSMRILIIEFGG